MKNRPELKEADLNVKKNKDSLTIAKFDYLPDLMLQYRRRDVTTGTDSQDAIVGFNLPLWFWKQASQVKEAKAEHAAAEAELDAEKNITLYDVKNLFVRVQTAARMIDLYETSVLPQADEALKVAQSGYQTEKINFLDLLDASRSLLNFRLEHVQHMADYEIALADLERAVGVDLNEEESK